MSLVAVAFQAAITREPGCRPSASTERAVTSVPKGCGAARPTRTRLPIGVREVTSAGSRFSIESA
jgi:hypothetical protein